MSHRIDYIEYIVAWISVIIIAIVLGVLFLYDNRKILKSFKMNRGFNTYLSILVFCFAGVRICFLISDFEYAAHGGTILFSQLVFLGYIFGFLGFGSMSLYFDRYIVNSKNKVLSLILVTFAVLNVIFFLILPFFIQFHDIFRFLLFGGLYLSGGIFLYSGLKVIKGTQIRNFKTIIWLLLGIILIILGSALDADELYEFYLEQPLFMLIPPIFIVIGMIIARRSNKLAFTLVMEYYSSNQICLVHRGKIESKIHFCPNCYVKYCKKCFAFVLSSENRCWACNYDFIKEEIITEDKLEKSEDDELHENHKK